MGARVIYRVWFMALLGLALALPGASAEAGVQLGVSAITLTIYSPQGAPWFDSTGRTQAVVEWQDGNGTWHAVENWRATPAAQIRWEVWPKDYGTGPFRWTVYAVYEGWRILGVSTPFYLPGADGQTISVVVALTQLPSDESGGPPPPPVCAQPADPDFRGLWEYYQTVLGCLAGPAIKIPTIAEEAFQGGHMFWRSDTDEVYIIYDRLPEGTESAAGYWQLHTAKWDGSNPDGVHLSPPPGLFEPKRGFGWVWRNFLGGASGPMGWALDKEYGFDNVARTQRFDRGVIFRGSAPRTYVLLDDYRFYAQ
jgi:hypothetical protein